MEPLKAGVQAPQFTGKDQNGRQVSLQDFIGKKVILYFYPKDDTPGCTAEACNLRDNYTDLIGKGFVVIGVSPDNEKSHARFTEKFSLPFPLLADPELSICSAYGVWGEKSMYGKKYMGVLRTSFVIDEAGIILKVISKVITDDHARQIFEELEIK
jgi:peroxiredoxin Q/BCP